MLNAIITLSTLAVFALPFLALTWYMERDL